PSSTVMLAHDEVVEIGTEILALNEGLLKAGCGNKAVQALGKYEQPHAEQQLSHCRPPDNQVGNQRGGGELGQHVPQLPDQLPGVDAMERHTAGKQLERPPRNGT